MKRILLVLIMIFSSCSSKLDFKQPGNRFYIPESTGEKLAVAGKIHYAQGIKTTVSEIYRSSIFSSKVSVNNEPSLDESRGLGLEGRLGVHEMVDLELVKDHDTPFLFGAKVQVLGSGTRKKEDGFKLAFGAGLGTGTEESDSIYLTDGTETRSYKAEVDMFKWNLYSSTGYRFEEDFLVYINGYYTHYNTDSEVSSNNGQFTSFAKEEDLTNFGSNFGIHYLINKGFIQLEIGRQKVKYADNYQKYATPFGVALGFIN